jgi:hypothetical protein
VITVTHKKGNEIRAPIKYRNILIKQKEERGSKEIFLKVDGIKKVALRPQLAFYATG